MTLLEIRLKENFTVTEEYLHCVLGLYRQLNKNYEIIYLSEEVSKQPSIMAIRTTCKEVYFRVKVLARINW